MLARALMSSCNTRSRDKRNRDLLAQEDREPHSPPLPRSTRGHARVRLFAARQPDHAAESITPTVCHVHGDDRENSATLTLCSTFADALRDYRPELEAFLDE